MFFISCKKKELLILKSTNTHLTLNNGILEFEKQTFTGKLVEYYPNGAKKYEVTYAKGLKEGVEKKWHNNQKLAMQRIYNKGIKIGLHKAWWHNGIHKFEYNFNTKGEHHGNLKEWDITGLLIRDFNYKYGKESGTQKMWKKDGSIKSNYVVINGDRFGLIGLKRCYTVSNNSKK